MLFSSPSPAMMSSGSSPTFASLTVTGDLTVQGNLNFDSVSAQNIFLGDDDQLRFGNTSSVPDVTLSWNTTQTVDALFLGLATAQNTFIIAENGDIAFDFAHGAQTNPTLFIHSAAQSTTQWVSLAHNQTNAVLGWGTGTLVLSGTGVDVSAGILELNNYIRWDTGNALSPANIYQIGRNAVSQLQYNVVTGGSHAFSENGVVGVLFNATNFQANDNVNFSLGAVADAQFRYSTVQTPDSLMLGLSSDSNALVVVEKADLTFDFAHALQTNPTVFIHSANQSTTEWIGLQMNQTRAAIGSGQGGFGFFDGVFTTAANEFLRLDTSAALFGAGAADSAGLSSFFSVQGGGASSSGNGYAGGDIQFATGSGSDAFATGAGNGGNAGDFLVLLNGPGSGDGAGSPGAGGNFQIGDGNSYAHFAMAQQTAPTTTLTNTTLNDGGGSGATVTMGSGATDSSGSVTITAGNGTPIAGIAGQIVFDKTFKSAPKVVALSFKDADSVNNQPYVSAVSTTSFEISFGTALGSSEAVELYYIVIQ